MLHSVQNTTIIMVKPRLEKPCFFKKVIKNPNPPISIILMSRTSVKVSSIKKTVRKSSVLRYGYGNLGILLIDWKLKSGGVNLNVNYIPGYFSRFSFSSWLVPNWFSVWAASALVSYRTISVKSMPKTIWQIKQVQANLERLACDILNAYWWRLRGQLENTK